MYERFYKVISKEKGYSSLWINEFELMDMADGLTGFKGTPFSCMNITEAIEDLHSNGYEVIKSNKINSYVTYVNLKRSKQND